MEYNEIKQYLSDSDSRWKTLKDKIKDDRLFISGTQFCEDDDKILGKYRLKNAINIVNNTCNSIVNNYSKFPFSWYTDNDAVNQAIHVFFNTNNNGDASRNALLSSVAFGLGVFALSTDFNVYTGNVEPIIYNIPNVENVYLDPSISTKNGSDACKCAIIEKKSKQYIKNTYGDAFVQDINSKDSFNIDLNPKIEQAVVTYYEKTNDGVEVSVWTNGQQVDNNILKVSFIPVIPVFGEEVWEDDEISYQGLVRKIKPIQKLLNLSVLQLSERLAISPKPVFMATRDQVNGVEDYWKNMTKSLNPLLIYNGKDAKGNALQPPTRVDNTVRFEDLNGVMSSVLNLMTSITGINPTGLADDNKTATASLLESNAYSNNVSHFYSNLKQSFKLAGTIFCQIINVPITFLEVIQGVEEMNANVEARNVLTSMLSIMPNKSDVIMKAMLSTYPNNMVLNNVAMTLNDKSPRELELEKLVEQANNTIKMYEGKIAEMSNEMNNYDKQLNLEAMKIQEQVMLKQEDNRVKLAIEDAKNNTKLLETEMKLQAEDDKQVKDIIAKANGVK